MERYNWISFLGVFILMGFAWLFSENKRNMNWSAIAWGLALQLIFAFFIFMVPAGASAFLFVNDTVVKVLNAATAGTKFVFGSLALSPGEPGSLGFFLAFQTLPTIIFFSALMAILYYYRIMPLVIRGFAYVFTKLMKISGAESLTAASNIFVGVESALTIRPHLPEMTRSELCVVLTAGMATVSSNVLALYVFTLKQYFPTIAGHLISASILSAPAAILMAKIIVPETEVPVTLGQHIQPHYDRESSVFESIINGANAGVKLIVGIVALLLAVLGLVALADLLMIHLGGYINVYTGWQMDWSLKSLCGYLFYPFTVIIGVPLSDAWTMARIIGERLIVTEVTSYQDLAMALQNNLVQHPRSTVITTYALCGFAHLASMAIFIGGTAALAPGKTRVLAKLGFRALLAATLACLMTACMAGTFFTSKSILLGQ